MLQQYADPTRKEENILYVGLIVKLLNLKRKVLSLSPYMP